MIPYSLNTKDAAIFVDARLQESAPATRFEYVTVTFPASANTNRDIAHSLGTSAVDYTVVGWQFASAPSTAPVVYQDISGTARAWTDTYLTLRCNVANAQATLLLTLRRSA